MATETTVTPEADVEPTGIKVPAAPQEPAPTVTPSTPTPNGNAPRTFSEEEIERARQQERDKLYSRLDDQDKLLKALNEDLAARKAAEDAAAQQAKEAEEARKREELSAKELLDQKDAEWAERFASLRTEVEHDRAVLQREAQFQELVATRERMLGSVIEGDASGRTFKDTIAPQLLQYVGGNSQEEIAQSIAMAQKTTADILAEVQTARQRQQQQMKGASVTQPPVGPMETDSAYETLSASDIDAMSPEEYAKRRPALLAAASRARLGPR